MKTRLIALGAATACAGVLCAGALALFAGNPTAAPTSVSEGHGVTAAADPSAVPGQLGPDPAPDQNLPVILLKPVKALPSETPPAVISGGLTSQ